MMAPLFLSMQTRAVTCMSLNRDGVLSVRDEEAGGTWFGFNLSNGASVLSRLVVRPRSDPPIPCSAPGRFAALTNVRCTVSEPEEPTSRGWLVHSMLTDPRFFPSEEGEMDLGCVHLILFS